MYVSKKFLSFLLAATVCAFSNDSLASDDVPIERPEVVYLIPSSEPVNITYNGIVYETTPFTVIYQDSETKTVSLISKKLTQEEKSNGEEKKEKDKEILEQRFLPPSQRFIPRRMLSSSTKVFSNSEVDVHSRALAAESEMGRNKARELSEMGRNKARELSEMGRNKARQLNEMGRNKARELSEMGRNKARELSEMGRNKARELETQGQMAKKGGDDHMTRKLAGPRKGGEDSNIYQVKKGGEDEMKRKLEAEFGFGNKPRELSAEAKKSRQLRFLAAEVDMVKKGGEDEMKRALLENSSDKIKTEVSTEKDDSQTLSFPYRALQGFVPNALAFAPSGFFGKA